MLEWVGSGSEACRTMQYGGGGYPGNQRLYTASLGSRRSGERGMGPGLGVNTLPNILWKASGVTTRPTSGLRLTVKNVNVPHPGPQGMQAARDALSQRTSARSTRSNPAGHPLQYLRATAQSHVRRSGSRPQQSSSSTASTAAPQSTPKAVRTMLPPLASSPPAVAEPPQGEGGSEQCSTDDEEDSSPLEDSDSEEEICSDDDEEDATNPPSRPGFESEAEQSTQIFDVPFVSVSNPLAAFPATLLQDHMQLDMERLARTVLPSGLSARVNNIVRAFSIHGPLDQDLLSQALNTVSNLHPVLAARFQRTSDRLYMQIPPGPVSVPLESPLVAHERPDTLIISARRKPFQLSLHNDLVSSSREDQGEREAGAKNMSVVSLTSKNSDDSNGKEQKAKHPTSLSKKSVTFGQVTAMKRVGPLDTTPPVLPAQELAEEQPRILIRARLVRESVHDATLVLSFPRIICDYWSSCLFVQQLADVYAKLEKNSTHRPSLAARRIQAKRRELAGKYGRQERVLQTRPHTVARDVRPSKQSIGAGNTDNYRLVVPARLNFQQVAHREKQLLKFVSKEKLWAFWDSMLTATIQRQRGPNRIKVVPPVRIPSGLGDKITRVRPQTSRLRPLTGRARPQTGRKVAREMATNRDSLAGPKTEFLFLKFEEEVCAAFRMAFPDEHQTSVKEEELLCLVCLGTYVLLVGKCCRGWGEEEGGGRGRRETDHSPPVLAGSRTVGDPLHQYKMDRVHRSHEPLKTAAVVIPAAQGPSPRRTRRATMAGRLDLGSFLIGVEVSLRHSHPRISQGLFGPLTNDVGVRINLSSCETFVDLVLALGKSLQSVRNHHHFPFTTVTDELGVPASLPVRFSYLYRSDILQLSDPTHFYFPETAIGVKGHGLARFGSSCYLSPLCTKLDDSRHLELCLWEGYDSDHVGGVFLFQPQVLRRDLVETLAKELTQLMAVVARDPCVPLTHLASQLPPPFSSTRARHHRTAISQL